MPAIEDLTVVASWSDKAHSIYGQRFLSGFFQHWSSANLRFWADADLVKDPKIRAFRERESDSRTNTKHWQWGAMKWSWKVFALAATALEVGRGWMLWIDGDVEFRKPPTPEFLDTICPRGADVSFLGRPWTYASETGFVAYNLDGHGVIELLQAMRDTYLNGGFRNLDNWGDAAVFDHCRAGRDLVENDLAKDCKIGILHVWPQTVLAEFLVHQKGPARKLEAYGGTV